VQDFALSVSGDLPLPGEGIIALDRAAYSAPAIIQLKLIDFDLRGQSSARVLLSSSTEPLAEEITLPAHGTAGTFTGAVATAVGPPTRDGRLQVSHDDLIEVVYEDAAPPVRRTAEASADLVAPVLSEISAATRFGRMQVTWFTDELADSIVDFGSTPALGQSVTNRVLVEEHRVALGGLVPGQTIYYRVRSRDIAGNLAVGDNAGAPFQAVVSATATVLLVDAFDDLLLNDYLSAATYTDALDQIGADYEVWDVALEGRSPQFEDLRNYPVVIWRNGEFFSSLGTQEVKAMRDYVDAGGGLFMASMELLSRLDESGFENFRKNILQVEEYEIDPGIGGIYGGQHLSMTSGIDTPLDFSEFPDLIIIPQDISDTFRTTTNGVPILFDSATGQAVGVRYPRVGTEGTGRVVFFSFPFDALPAEGEPPNTRAEILRRVLAFLAPGSAGVAEVELDREAYTLPAVATMVLVDGDLASQSSVSVILRSDRNPGGQVLELLATGRPGRFRGSITLLSETNAPAPGVLLVRDGDVIEAFYEDARPSQTLRVAAVIDISPPEISGVEIEADYNEAIVAWTTSEPADGLAKYRDVAFPSNFTTYHSDFTMTHELHLVGLEPDRDYAVEIVCRDPAGNVAVDNNGGQFHRFRTLRPLDPPFVDNLESGGGNWTAADSELDAETLSILASSTWELGAPSNELADSAHSPVNCWATNLRGEVNDYADTSLISPAILLSGGNRATVRFWHNYDFFPRSDDFDIVEVGGLYVTTNNGAAWLPLREYSEASDAWEAEEVDLSAYLGRVVRLGWAYGLFSFGSVQHPGWLVDDIAVEVTSFVPGTLVVSNNLNQAAVTIRGPLNRVERGLLSTITNAPPGEYSFEYADVPFYSAPSPRSHALPEGGTLLVAGAYTFADSNANGISDAWEQQYLGGVAPGHSPADDRDHDGSSDLAEFMAGTNPTNAVSRLQLLSPQLATTGDLLVRWESTAGRGYRVQGSMDAIRWETLTDWIMATSSASTATVPFPTGGRPYLFRLEVRP
jgi:hypothetical protein